MENNITERRHWSLLLENVVREKQWGWGWGRTRRRTRKPRSTAPVTTGMPRGEQHLKAHTTPCLPLGLSSLFFSVSVTFPMHGKTIKYYLYW